MPWDYLIKYSLLRGIGDLVLFCVYYIVYVYPEALVKIVIFFQGVWRGGREGRGVREGVGAWHIYITRRQLVTAFCYNHCAVC